MSNTLDKPLLRDPFCMHAKPCLAWTQASLDHHTVVSNSLQPHGLQPTRLLCPWDSPGNSTGVGCHALLQGIFPTQGSNPSLLHLPALTGRFFTTRFLYPEISHPPLKLFFSSISFRFIHFLNHLGEVN